MKSCLCCWRQTVSEIQKWIFDMWPYISVTPSLTQPRCSPLNCPPYVRRGQAYPPLLSPFFLSMSAGFSGHLPERMPGAWRPGSEGDWCLCHPSRQLPLSWCIIEPLNQLLPHCHLAYEMSRVQNRSRKKKKQHNKAKGDWQRSQGYIPPSSLIYTWGVMGLCCATGQQRMRWGSRADSSV